jgi:hypothetical protein
MHVESSVSVQEPEPRRHRVPGHDGGPLVVRVARLSGDSALRTRHIMSDTILADGVGPGHDSARMAAALRGQWS